MSHFKRKSCDRSKRSRDSSTDAVESFCKNLYNYLTIFAEFSYSCTFLYVFCKKNFMFEHLFWLFLIKNQLLMYFFKKIFAQSLFFFYSSSLFVSSSRSRLAPQKKNYKFDQNTAFWKKKKKYINKNRYCNKKFLSNCKKNQCHHCSRTYSARRKKILHMSHSKNTHYTYFWFFSFP